MSNTVAIDATAFSALRPIDPIYAAFAKHDAFIDYGGSPASVKAELNLVVAGSDATTPEGVEAHYQRFDEIARSYPVEVRHIVEVPMLANCVRAYAEALEEAGATDKAGQGPRAVVGRRSIKALIAAHRRAYRAWNSILDRWHQLLTDIDPTDEYHDDNPRTRLKVEAMGRLKEYTDLRAEIERIGKAEDDAAEAFEQAEFSSKRDVEDYCAYVRHRAADKEDIDGRLIVGATIRKFVGLRNAQLAAAA